jgi:hypothetical protein
MRAAGGLGPPVAQVHGQAIELGYRQMLVISQFAAAHRLPSGAMLRRRLLEPLLPVQLL